MPERSAVGFNLIPGAGYAFIATRRFGETLPQLRPRGLRGGVRALRPAGGAGLRPGWTNATCCPASAGGTSSVAGGQAMRLGADLPVAASRWTNGGSTSGRSSCARRLAGEAAGRHLSDPGAAGGVRRSAGAGGVQLGRSVRARMGGSCCCGRSRPQARGLGRPVPNRAGGGVGEQEETAAAKPGRSACGSPASTIAWAGRRSSTTRLAGRSMEERLRSGR